eukprot:COSAG02_NODE_50403_length_320_cov_1.452489_1_plen_87_part_01
MGLPTEPSSHTARGRPIIGGYFVPDPENAAHVMESWERQDVQPVARQYDQIPAYGDQVWEFQGVLVDPNFESQVSINARQARQRQLV